MIRRTWLILATLALAGLLILAACGDDDDDDGGDDGNAATPTGGAEASETPAETADAAAIAELEDLARQMSETDPTEDAAVDFVLGHITDEALGYFGYESAEDCAANAEDCIGEPSDVVSLENTEIAGDQASTTLTASNGDVLNLVLVRENGVWKLSGFGFSADIPEGVTTVNVTAIEYGFDWDAADVGDGNVAFRLTNDGQEMHELAIASVSEDFDVEAVKQWAQSDSGEEDPPGTTGLIGFTLATPNVSANIPLEEPLAPGNYALLCFLPSPNGTPHVVLNMYSEFTVE